MLVNRLGTPGQLNYNNTQYPSRNDAYGFKDMQWNNSSTHPNDIVPCGISYSDVDTLQQQAINTHPSDITNHDLPINANVQVDFFCHICLVSLHSLDDWRRHTENVHPNVRSDYVRMNDNDLFEQGTPDLQLHREQSHSSYGNVETVLVEAESDSTTEFMENTHCSSDESSAHTELNLNWKMALTCETCGSLFETLVDLHSHKNIAHPVAENNGIRETQESDVKKTSQPKTEFMCEPCGRYFRNRCYLTQHTNSRHNAARLYKCVKCSKRFVTKANLAEHFAKHSEKGEFMCQEENCGKRFHYNTDLMRHGRTHTKELHYCVFCDKGFVRFANLQHHHQNKHLNLAKKKQKE